MSQYTPLYLKYRPQALSELVGQPVVSKTLSNAIQYNKIAHAYLFCGPRGTGKTSTARILAKSLNCEKGPTVSPCGICNSCVSIRDCNSLDVIEIDAASHRKVEDAEDLINRVGLGTYGSRYKIYIIDEVHMLTDHAFNALLKTLEEPPKNVIFILATTEDYKVIPTIISRCQKLDFKTIKQNDLEKRLQEISSQENILISDQVIKFVASRARGCLRDAVSFLDQISVLQDGQTEIKSTEVYDLFGTVNRNELLAFSRILLNFQHKETVEKAENIIKSGKDLNEIFKSIIELFIDLGKAKIDSVYKKVLQDETGEDLNFLDKVSLNHILKIINVLNDNQSKLRFSLSQELQFMSTIMIMLDKDLLVSLTELKDRISSRNIVNPIVHKVQEETTSKPQVVNSAPPVVEKVESILLDASEKIIVEQNNDYEGTWKKIVGMISSNPTKTLLLQMDSYLIGVSEDLLEIGVQKDMFLPRLKDDQKKIELILNAVKIVTGISPKDIRYTLKKRENKLEDKSIQVNLDIENKYENVDDSLDPIPVSPPISSDEIPKTSVYEDNDDDLAKAVKTLLGGRKIN